MFLSVGHARNRLIDATHEPGKVSEPFTPGFKQISNAFDFGTGQIGVRQVPVH